MECQFKSEVIGCHGLFDLLYDRSGVSGNVDSGDV